MDLILRDARIADGEGERAVDIGIAAGRIAAIEPALAADAETLELGGRLVTPGFVETHVHLDKSRILDRCAQRTGTLDEAIAEVAKAKRNFTAEDVYDRARATLERCILNGTTHMRTHLEVDPVVGLKGLEGILPLVEEYSWAIDLEICIFPQDGLLNLPGTDELMVAALQQGGSIVGACPYTDTDPRGQIDRVFEMARELDRDIDMHLDFDLNPDDMDLLYVCEQTERFGYGGRVAIGHVSKLSAADPDRFAQAARRLAGAGVALTVLPATDLYLMGRGTPQNVPRGLTPVHKLLEAGVNCSLSTNNVLNPFTPFGDCSLIRMANLYANVCQVGTREDILECLAMITERSARLMRLDDYGLAVGRPADLVVLDCADRAGAVAELATPLWGFKRGRRTFTRAPATLHRP
ncbi:MAG: amidohydrolase family protein [Alphaproteobacteria bacterium]|nr:amidohydrolase family protein [Alphaproteobacteria bacterium]